MLRLATFILLLLTLSACGQKGAVTDAKFVISGVTAAEAASGSVLLTAFNPKSELIFRMKMQNSLETLELPDGDWVFSVVYWDAIDTEAAVKVRCGQTQALLEGKELAISIELLENTCKTADFNDPQFDVAGAFQPLELNQCASFGVATADCNATPGVARSFKIVLPSILPSPIDNPALDTSAPSVMSNCLEIAPNDGTESSTTMLPSGSASAPIPFLIRTYSGPSCTGDITTHNFRRGLLTGDEGSLRVHDYTPTNTTRILVRSGSLVPLHASVSIPAESTYKFNLSNFVTGGTAPYSFTLAPVIGNLVGTMFNGVNTPQSTTVTVTDANSIVTTFNLNTVIATHHTIFEGSSAIIGKWSVSRPTSQLSMLNPGEFTMVSSNFPRFLNTPLLASPSIAADKYLVVEKNSTTNLLQNPVNYDSATWVKPSGITVTSQGMTDISPNQEHFLVTKTTTAGTSLYQSLGTLNANHVGSVYLKQGSSRFAGLQLENVSGTCTGLVVDLQTGQTVAMSGCPLLNTGPGLHGAQYIGGGWWRVWVTRTFSSVTGGLFKIYPSWNTTLNAVNDTNVLGSVYSFNAQLEAADRPLFPMVNYNATRGIELASMDVPTSINLSTGTFLFDWHAREPEPNKTLLSFCNGTSDLMNISIVSGLPRVTIQGSNIVQESSQQDITLESQNRIAFKLDSGSAKLFKRNDSTPASTASGMSAGTPTSGYLGRNCAASPTYYNLGARRFGYWTTVFEDVVLKEMSNDSN